MKTPCRTTQNRMGVCSIWRLIKSSKLMQIIWDHSTLSLLKKRRSSIKRGSRPTLRRGSRTTPTRGSRLTLTPSPIKISPSKVSKPLMQKSWDQTTDLVSNLPKIMEKTTDLSEKRRSCTKNPLSPTLIPRQSSPLKINPLLRKTSKQTKGF